MNGGRIIKRQPGSHQFSIAMAGKDRREKGSSRDDRHRKHRREKRHRREASSDDSVPEDEELRKRRGTDVLVKKVTKHLMKHQSSVAGYSNEDNLFNDPNLSERFVWRKKIEKEIDEGVPLSKLSAKSELVRQQERLKEIEKVKAAREEREAERARQMEELSLIERARYAAEATEAAAKEEEFLFKQALASCRLRVRSGRMEPIDFVARNVDPELAVESAAANEPPYLVFNRLNLEEMQKLFEGINQFKDLDRHDPVHSEFWKTMHEIATHELTISTQQDMMDRAKLKGEARQRTQKAEELHVESEVQALLAGKTYTELGDLEKQLLTEVESGDCADPEYYETVLSHLKVHKARAKLRALQDTLMQRHYERLVQIAKEQQEEQIARGTVGEQDEPEDSPQSGSPADAEGTPEVCNATEKLDTNPNLRGSSSQPVLALDGAKPPVADDERFSPEPVDPQEIEEEDVVSEAEDESELERLRAEVKLQYSDRFRHAADMAAAAACQMSASDRAYQAMILDPSRHPSGVHPMLRHITEAAPQGDDPLAFRSGRAPPVEDEDPATQRMRAEAIRRMGDDRGDQPFGGEVKLESRVYWWHEKYRPRKPKYFNRVHTGYEWNKYNQTHYDHDNPPPKVVQGYKFNIFYPDLMDKCLAPSYALEKDPQSKDGSTCNLRFKAGPPYEDIAFRIVNKDWEYSHKKGFKCTFERGILHLYFNFKRQRYRR